MRMNKTRGTTDDTLQAYFDQIRAIPLLSFEEEVELSKRIQHGDEVARHRLIEANLRLVVKNARPYMTADVPFMDIIQEGNMGLMRAAEKYDYKKNVLFATYANWWIRQSISRFFSNKRRAIRLPHRKEELFHKIQRAYHTLSQTLVHQPSSEELAAFIGVPVEDVNFILGITHGFLSLEMEMGAEESTLLVDLHEDYTYNPERAFLRKSDRDTAIHFLDRLKDREKRVLTYRYQLNGGKHYTLREIGDKMDISAETVRQIDKRALKKIRGHAEELKDCMYLEAM